ncbi:MAG: hypothetical protein BJ554DRAFT_7891 [Olpidium bornovanus]|uniref:Uncharacterized protein n=1 Tax=Olpidium bornovanus TaxID=278681 RepID=A0A8H8DIR5_9FUNG|nr:MAG: hypothetical protein BJ554DRAFT_7891 [Olpidium bornovanus]
MQTTDRAPNRRPTSAYPAVAPPQGAHFLVVPPIVRLDAQRVEDGLFGVPDVFDAIRSPCWSVRGRRQRGYSYPFLASRCHGQNFSP